jgi:hypothetical protein
MSLGIYFLGMAGMIYRLTLIESIVYGSLLAAIDPVRFLYNSGVLKQKTNIGLIMFVLDSCVGYFPSAQSESSIVSSFPRLVYVNHIVLGTLWLSANRC